jgi:formylglycine-generating enzyme required for sulfatase activity
MKKIGINWIRVEGLEKPFYIGSTPITFDQYDRYCEDTGKEKPNDEKWGRGTRPVINVSFEDAQQYCSWASQITGYTIRLPNEKEWEYSARGGVKSRQYDYSGANNLEEVGWFKDNSISSRTTEVEMLRENELGISDMSGNVWEWIGEFDRHIIDAHMVRGGSFNSDKEACQVNMDSYHNPGVPERQNDCGFRCVRE